MKSFFKVTNVTTGGIYYFKTNQSALSFLADCDSNHRMEKEELFFID